MDETRIILIFVELMLNDEKTIYYYIFSFYLSDHTLEKTNLYLF